MRRLISGSKRGWIGLDVSDGSLEAVQLRSNRRSKTFQMAGWSRVVLPPGVVSGGRVVKTQELTEALRQLFSKPTFGSIDGRQVVLTLPEHQTFHYVTSLSSWEGDAGLFGQIQSYLASKLPFAVEEAYWDWRVVRDEPTQAFIYICASPRDVVDEYRKALKSMGMVLSVVEAQVQSTCRLFWSDLALKEPVLFLDIGSDETSISTIDDIGIHQSSVVTSGAMHFTQRLATELKADRAVAERVIRSIGLRNVKHPKTASIHEAIKQPLATIVQEARQHVSYYNVQPHIEHAIIKQILLLGGGALVPGVAEYLAQELKLSVMPPASRFSFKPPLSPADLALLSNATGAAVLGAISPELRRAELNLLVTRRSYQETKSSWLKKLWTRLRRKTKPSKPVEGASA
jgi:type IV pilus assembly protein PilM